MQMELHHGPAGPHLLAPDQASVDELKALIPDVRPAPGFDLAAGFSGLSIYVGACPCRTRIDA